MGKFTTTQLQAALVELYKRTDTEALDAFRMTFDELARRMGDEAFDKWCTDAGL